MKLVLLVSEERLSAAAVAAVAVAFAFASGFSGLSRRSACFFIGELGEKRLSGEVVSTLFVNAEELNGEHIAFLNDVFNLFNELVGKILDVAQTFLAGSELNERADRDDTGYLAGVNCAFFGLEADRIDHCLCGKTAVAINSGDIDRAIVLDVDLRASVSNNLLDRKSVG